VLAKLGEHRLLTLTGPGGVGKTRLATEACGRLEMPALFTGLAPVTDPSQVPYAALGAIGIHERVIARQAGGGDPLDRLTDALADREAVLVLDNCEHVIDAVAELASRVLADCPKVTVLATSREPLRITGEALWPVAPLRVPSEGDGASGVVLDYGAVRLLRDRVAAAVPGFEVDAGNAAAVARVCRALDGMPLAIELAAPWLRTLTPQQLATRLDDRFALLTGGSRTALPRHQTLRAVVDWSWDLLSPSERALARRLAAFPSGATLEAAEATCASGGLPCAAVLPTLSGPRPVRDSVSRSSRPPTSEAGTCRPRRPWRSRGRSSREGTALPLPCCGTSLRDVGRRGDVAALDALAGAGDGDEHPWLVPGNRRPPAGGLRALLRAAPRAGRAVRDAGERLRERDGRLRAAILVGPEVGDRTLAPVQQDRGAEGLQADPLGPGPGDSAPRSGGPGRACGPGRASAGAASRQQDCHPRACEDGGLSQVVHAP
jgi:hypothetical protein